MELEPLLEEVLLALELDEPLLLLLLLLDEALEHSCIIIGHNLSY